MWRDTDPRHLCSDLNRDMDIVVVRPHLKGQGAREAAMGYTSTKEGWCVWISFQDGLRFLDVDAKWPDAWWWIEVPEKA